MLQRTLMQCVEKSEFIPLELKGFRCVEDQSQSATKNLVDNILEHDILEQEIEHSKPVIPSFCRNLHFLISTPFRYRPAKWGSRFGTRNQPSMLYGSLEENTALAETAYYQLRFFLASRGKFKVTTKAFCVFEINIKSVFGFNLTTSEFDFFKNALKSVDVYSETQSVGTHLRNRNVEAFLFWSARCDGTNFALFTPKCVIGGSKTPPQKHWEASVSSNRIVFSRRGNRNQSVEFQSEMFYTNGVFPAIPS